MSTETKQYPKYAIEIWGGDVQGEREYFNFCAEAEYKAAEVIAEMKADGIDGYVKVLGVYSGGPFCLEEISSTNR